MKCLILFGFGSHLTPIDMFECKEEEDANFIVWRGKLL